MAQYTINTPSGFSSIPDKRKVSVAGGQVPNSPLGVTFLAADKDISAMRAQLTTFNAGLYPSITLDAMTANDMVFALRVAYESAGMF